MSTNIQMNYETCEESGYNGNVNMLIISYQSNVSFPSAKVG